MKTEILNTALKAVISSQDEKTQRVLSAALHTLSDKENKAATATFAPRLDAFIAAKAQHTENMLKLNDIDTAIRRSEKERQAALEEGERAEQNWRSRFRELRGAITPEMKSEHSQRIASRELAEEFAALTGELEDDKTRAMLSACRTGEAYVGAHLAAFTTYAKNEWNAAIRDMNTALTRAFCLRLRELEMNGDETPKRTLIAELGERLSAQSQFHSFNMENEPVLSQLGLYRPALTGVDMKLYNSPAKRMMIAKKLAEKASVARED
jgi:hypothetical protein